MSKRSDQWAVVYQNKTQTIHVKYLASCLSWRNSCVTHTQWQVMLFCFTSTVLKTEERINSEASDLFFPKVKEYL